MQANIGIGSETPRCNLDIQKDPWAWPKRRLIIGYNPDGPHLFEVTGPQPMPNIWIRFWHRVLLGCPSPIILGWERWEAIEQDDET